MVCCNFALQRNLWSLESRSLCSLSSLVQQPSIKHHWWAVNAIFCTSIIHVTKGDLCMMSAQHSRGGLGQRKKNRSISSVCKAYHGVVSAQCFASISMILRIFLSFVICLENACLSFLQQVFVVLMKCLKNSLLLARRKKFSAFRNSSLKLDNGFFAFRNVMELTAGLFQIQPSQSNFVCSFSLASISRGAGKLVFPSIPKPICGHGDVVNDLFVCLSLNE